MSEYIVRMPPDMPYEIRAELNAWYVESEPIVRCRDCEYYVDDEMEYYHYCNKWCEQVEPDGFCKWGERRNDGQAK